MTDRIPVQNCDDTHPVSGRLMTATIREQSTFVDQAGRTVHQLHWRSGRIDGPVDIFVGPGQRDTPRGAIKFPFVIKGAMDIGVAFGAFDDAEEEIFLQIKNNQPVILKP